MKRRVTRPHLVIASLLSLLLLATVAMPATAATPTRSESGERYAHKLVNCLRTGGKILADGRCKGRGSGRYSKYVAPLQRSHRISRRVAWPWARRTAGFTSRRSCWIGHSRAGSTVDSRFQRISLTAVANGENMGCYLTYPRRAVLKIVLMWQRERAWQGWHWRQLKSRSFQSAGYGVAHYGARKTQLVVNFYGGIVD